MTGKKLLQQMATTYATCTSYCDTGVVSTLFFEEKGSRLVEKPFSTAFVRPDRFRFEYRNGNLVEIVWRDGTKFRTRCGMMGWGITLVQMLSRKRSLRLGLAALTGVSGGSAHTIPALLCYEQVGGRRLTDMTAVQRIDDALLDDVACYRITGKYAEYLTVLWIEKATLCLRRLEVQQQFDHFRTEKTTTYFPAMNGEIDEQKLSFEGGGI